MIDRPDLRAQRNYRARRTARFTRMKEALEAYIRAYDAGTGTVYVEPQIRAALED